MIGTVFGRLTVESLVGTRRKRDGHTSRFWSCRCACGNVIEVATGSLNSGNTRSCGCLQRDFAGKLNLVHGKSKTAEFGIWASMLQRCENPHSERYPDYGGRGIAVCGQWHDFTTFLADMGPRPSRRHSIERKNNDGNYEPENCAWVTHREQCNNKRTNRRYSFNGESLTLSQWSDRPASASRRYVGDIAQGGPQKRR